MFDFLEEFNNIDQKINKLDIEINNLYNAFKQLEDMDIIRKEAFTDIDKCLAHILYNSVRYLKTIGKECDDATMTAYEFYKSYYKVY